MKSMKSETMNFTTDELNTLSTALLSLIGDVNKAMVLVYDKTSLIAMQNARSKYQDLNRKICDMIENME